MSKVMLGFCRCAGDNQVIATHGGRNLILSGTVFATFKDQHELRVLIQDCAQKVGVTVNHEDIIIDNREFNYCRTQCIQVIPFDSRTEEQKREARLAVAEEERKRYGLDVYDLNA